MKSEASFLACHLHRLTLLFGPSRILFGDLAAYHLIFAPFGFDITKQGLAFIPIGIGLLLTLTAIPFSYSRYLRVTKKVQEEKRLNGDKNWEQAEPPPEER